MMPERSLEHVPRVSRKVRPDKGQAQDGIGAGPVPGVLLQQRIHKGPQLWAVAAGDRGVLAPEDGGQGREGGIVGRSWGRPGRDERRG